MSAAPPGATQLIGRFLADPTLTDLEMIKAHLAPTDPIDLRLLQGRCLIESRRALQAGHLFEASRLDGIARQLGRLAER